MKHDRWYYCKLALRLLLVLALVAVLFSGLILMRGEGLISLWLADAQQRWWVLVVTSVVYALILAIPFVPGVELGWLIMGLFGKWGLLAAWLSTVAGLSLSFVAARQFRAHPLLTRVHQARAALEQASPDQLSPYRKALRQVLSLYARYPYVFLFCALNLPGNWVIGGGGGIAVMTGLTPGVRFLRFLPTVTVATGMVPLALWLGVV